MPKRLARTPGRLARTAVLVLLGVVVLVGGTVLAVPQWRESVLPSGTVTFSAGPPPGWRPPQTASPPALPLQALDPSAAPAAKALAARIPKLAEADAGAAPGLVLLDPQTGKTLVSRGGDKAMMPASTMKVLTSVAALDTLGAERTFTTSVVSTGKGSIVLRGGGDPLLTDSRRSGRASLQDLAVATADALKKAGRTSVSLGYDASLFTGASWHPRWTDNYRYSVAPIQSLMVNGGYVASTGKAEDDPAGVAAKKFGTRLKALGIKVSSIRPARASGSATEVAAVESPTVAQIIDSVLRYSNNVAAQVLARQMGLLTKRGGSFADGQAAVVAALKRLKLWRSGMVIDDNSGLSRNNRVTGSGLAATVALILNEPEFQGLAESLPTGGVSGTLFNRFDDRNERAGRGAVWAKTGSLRDVRSLAGFLITADGAPLVFAIQVNQVKRPLATEDWIDATIAAWSGCGC